LEIREGVGDRFVLSFNEEVWRWIKIDKGKGLGVK
jgi:hypothetical protein